MPRDLQPGDLVFFSTTAPGPSHVGMSIGGDEFIHAPSTAGVVRVERLSGTYWAPRFVGARRIM
jgi:cell wall-associated NlpC family hydrolase